MNRGKIILPALVLAAVMLIYFSYFESGDDLGLFSEFDTNNNGNKEILVKIVPEKGIQRNGSGGTAFYAEDRSGKQVMVSGPASLPEGIETAGRIVLTGHYSGDSFHAHDVRIEN
jgi:hypothetical protein